MATQNMSQAMNNLKDLHHPIAPAVGVTVPTMAGDLSVGNNNGYLQLGDYTTKVPMQDFRNHMNANPDAAQTFAQALATSNLNNSNAYDTMGRSYEKTDNGNVENLLSNVQYYQRTQTKNTEVGLGTVADILEQQMEMMEEQMARTKEDKAI